MFTPNNASKAAQKTYRALKKNLPPEEWEAVELWLGTFFQYQAEWLLDWSPQAILNKCRQIGASHTLAAAALLWGMLGERTAVISLTEEDANLLLDKVSRHSRVLQKIGSVWAYCPKPNKGVISLNSGGVIRSSVQRRGARSSDCNVILDEFAYYDNPDSVLDAALGSTTHGYKLRILSTPNGEGNEFHNLWSNSDRNGGFTKFETTIYDAVRDGNPIDIEQCRTKALNDERIFEQLYCCSFIDNDLQYISYDLINACQESGPYPSKTGITFGGMDLGRTNDLTARVIVEVFDDKSIWVKDIQTRKRTADADIDMLVDEGINVYKCDRFYLDEQGMGTFPSERLTKKYPRIVHGFPMTMQSKEELVTKLYQMAANNKSKDTANDNEKRGSNVTNEYRLRIPTNAPWSESLRRDVASIRRIVTRAGNVTYDAPHTADGHADRAWALALALHRAKLGRGSYTTNLDY